MRSASIFFIVSVAMAILGGCSNSLSLQPLPKELRDFEAVGLSGSILEVGTFVGQNLASGSPTSQVSPSSVKICEESVGLQTVASTFTGIEYVLDTSTTGSLSSSLWEQLNTSLSLSANANSKYEITADELVVEQVKDDASFLQYFAVASITNPAQANGKYVRAVLRAKNLKVKAIDGNGIGVDIPAATTIGVNWKREDKSTFSYTGKDIALGYIAKDAPVPGLGHFQIKSGDVLTLVTDDSRNAARPEWDASVISSVDPALWSKHWTGTLSENVQPVLGSGRYILAIKLSTNVDAAALDVRLESGKKKSPQVTLSKNKPSQYWVIEVK